ncbi:hypothetical protein FB45DRAFT_843944 [Roridomyces roridus]|uniref:Uncharacterized protein n=1 Tax=Roridomyces roridus TaxID=1738132 RepID=A0AAD7B748_9AGAR|nr:hypothetical protein FB45DRAFT_843944 [Roridomyces roridus]
MPVTKKSTTAAAAPSDGSPKKKRAKKKETAELDTLQSKKDALHKEFSKSQKTRKAYDGYLARARAFVKDITKERRLKEAKTPGWQNEDGLDTDLLEKALEGPPNKHSAAALELFITQKCVVEGCKKSTADGIHGAFADYWDNLGKGKYAGAYKLEEETGKVTGCPARAPEIEALMKCVKTKTLVKGEAATRRHAEAMAIEDIRKIVDWSKQQCSSKELAAGSPADRSALVRVQKHGFMRAFLASGYCLWTRNFELCQLQERDLTLDQRGPAPHCLPYIGIFLDNRKGWQSKQGWDGPLSSAYSVVSRNHYNIYEQPDTPEICMYTHLLAWRKLYQERINRPFEPDDYIFPYISPNGTIHPKKPMSHDLVQEQMNELASGAGVNKIFTTHCLRRGGSQYRFMFAPIGKRWSLSIIRWWGGWAEGEQVRVVDTLMRYLLDSLQSYESGHGDNLNPHRWELDKSFMGENDALKPATSAELRTLTSKLMTAISSSPPQPQHDCARSHAPNPLSSISNAVPQLTTIRTAASPSQVAASHLTSGQATTTSELSTNEARGTSSPLPLAGIVIPSVGKDHMSWRRAVDQWEVGDPAVHLVPLKDWPREHYTGCMRTMTGSTYAQRKLIAMEFQRLGRDNAVFMAEYPEYSNITKLLKAIRQKTGRTRRART